MERSSTKPQISLDKVTIGTDCEIFAYDPIQKEHRSCVGRIGGMKGFPIDIGNNCGLEEDNVSAEFTVPPVPLIGGEEKMYANIQYCLGQIKERLPESWELAVVPSAIFPKGELSSIQAQVFGCEPDFNAWNHGAENPRPHARDRRLRSCGGHIHIGYENPSADTTLSIVKALDLFITLPSLHIDTDTLRRELYGKAGAFRDKFYGVEYRSISNCWIKEKDYVQWVFMAITDALNFVNGGGDLTDDAVKIVQAINTSDKTLADELCAKYAVVSPVPVAV